MPTINVTNRSGETSAIQADTGLSLMEVLREHGYDEEIPALCGGCCSCATCHVHIETPDNQPLPSIEEDEEMLVEMTDAYQQGLSRLSCQIDIADAHEGLEVTLVEAD